MDVRKYLGDFLVGRLRSWWKPPAATRRLTKLSQAGGSMLRATDIVMPGGRHELRRRPLGAGDYSPTSRYILMSATLPKRPPPPLVTAANGNSPFLAQPFRGTNSSTGRSSGLPLRRAGLRPRDPLATRATSLMAPSARNGRCAETE